MQGKKTPSRAPARDLSLSAVDPGSMLCGRVRLLAAVRGNRSVSGLQRHGATLTVSDMQTGDRVGRGWEAQPVQSCTKYKVQSAQPGRYSSHAQRTPKIYSGRERSESAADYGRSKVVSKSEQSALYKTWYILLILLVYTRLLLYQDIKTRRKFHLGDDKLQITRK